MRSEHEIRHQKQHANIDRSVRQIEHEKVLPEGVKIQIVNNCSMEQAIKSIPESAAYDRPKTRGGKNCSAIRQPPRQERHRRDRESEQSDMARRGILDEQAERDASVPP